MATPNSLYIPITQMLPMAKANFLHVLKLLDPGLGLIDYLQAAKAGGQFIQRPKLAQINADFERQVDSNPMDTALTPRVLNRWNEVMPVVRVTSYMEYYDVEQVQAGVPDTFIHVNMIQQWAIKAARSMILKCYGVGIAMANAITGSTFTGNHVYSVYDPITPVYLTPEVLRAARYCLGDHFSECGAMFMHSKMVSGLEQAALGTSFNVFNVMGYAFDKGIDAFPTIVNVACVADDQAPVEAGVTSGDPNIYHGLLFRPRHKNPLKEAPLTISEQQDFTLVAQHKLGQAGGCQRQLQIEQAYAIGGPGVGYDTTQGANPDDATLFDPTSWTNQCDDHRTGGTIDVVVNAL